MRDHMDPAFGQALEERFAELVSATPDKSLGRGGATSQGIRRQTIWVTVAVGVVVVLAAAFAIRAGQQSTPPAVSPTVTSSTTLSNTALLAKLPKQPYGKTIHTWRDTDTSSTTGPFSFVGSTAVIAAVCDGGGAIGITDTSGSMHKESCTRLDVQQPFWKFNLGGDGNATKTTGPVHVTVKVLAGTPRYIVRLWAVDPRILDADKVSVGQTSATVPKSLRTCTATDLAPTGSVARSTGVVTIHSRATTDCAIRSWPALQFVSAGGSAIGPIWGKDLNGRSIDSSEGAVNKYGEFPPARLAAGGSAYLIVSLVTKQELQKEDAQDKARPTPTSGPSIPPIPACDPVTAASIRLNIGGATVSIPTPVALDVAACTTSTRSFAVTPVVTVRPRPQG